MKSSIFGFSLVLFLGAAAAASAQDQPQQGQPQGAHGGFMQACGSDIQTYCSAAQNRDDRHTCMQANKDKFSDACKSFMASRHMHDHGQMQGPAGGQQGPAGGQ